MAKSHTGAPEAQTTLNMVDVDFLVLTGAWPLPIST